jgi:hypothetical protein
MFGQVLICELKIFHAVEGLHFIPCILHEFRAEFHDDKGSDTKVSILLN